jgi:hypothetical protein
MIKTAKPITEKEQARIRTRNARSIVNLVFRIQNIVQGV